jgi:hypothetical protein
VEFTEYREILAGIRADTEGADPLWDEATARLVKRAEGPAQVHEAAPELHTHTIEEYLARPYPLMMEDLAILVEYVAEREDAIAATGTAEAFGDAVKELKTMPWSDQEALTLKRLEALVPRVVQKEAETSNRPTAAPAPPPM